MIKVEWEKPMTLLPHEEIVSSRVDEVLNEISQGAMYPVIISLDRVILDGHHRTQAAKKIGLSKIPVIRVDYFSDLVQVFPRRTEINVSKEIVIKTAKSGKKFPHKTTKHLFDFTIQPIAITEAIKI